MLRRLLVTDRPLPRLDADVVVWVGGPQGSPFAGGRLVIVPSSVRAAAVYVAGAGPVELRLDLGDPAAFLGELALVDAQPALRAA